METLSRFASSLSGIIWGWGPVFPLIVIVLLGTGLVVTFALRWIQIRHLKHGLDVIRGRYDNPEHEGDITHFQALSTALSATVGIGNIAGVATAIHYGGPGALFWMWVTAVFGMALKYAECTLSMRFRVIHEDGSASGGPMYYIERGLGKQWKPLAVFFAICAVTSSFGSGNSVQAFTVADQLRDDLGIQTWITGLVMASLVALVILGGIKRIGRVTSRLAPFMAVVYVTGGVMVLIFNAGAVPGVFRDIFASAFEPAGAIGGFAGGSFIFMLTWGVKRGLFSNESGQGSAPIAHAAAKTDEPVREGVVAMIGPLIDTLMICTITGLVILTTGVWKDRDAQSLRINAQSAITVVAVGASVQPGGDVVEAELFDGIFLCEGGKPQGVAFLRNHSLVGNPVIRLGNGEMYEGTVPVVGGTVDFDAIRELWLDGEMMQNGSPLTAWAFRRGLAPLGDWGHLIVTFGVFLFALSTAISWSYYGDRAIVYLFGRQYVFAYKVIYCIIHYLGAVFALEVVWNFGDSALGLMAAPNLIALLLLLPATWAMTREYFSREHVPYR
jgi:AGCS family alanine or glycine:cation symporter